MKKVILITVLLILLVADIVYLVLSAIDSKENNSRILVAVFDLLLSEYVAIEIFVGLIIAIVISFLIL